MTTQPTQPEMPQPLPVVERVSRLEGIFEQANLRFAESTQAINALRTENHTEHERLRAESHAEYQSLRAENHAEHERLRAESHAEYQELRAENHAEHERLRAESHAEYQELRAENYAEHQAIHEKIDRLRVEMHRQTLIVVGVLGGLMALFRFVG